MKRFVNDLVFLLVAAMLIAACISAVVPKVGGMHGGGKAWTPWEIQTRQQMETLRDTIRRAGEEAHSGRRFNKYWYKSVAIPPEFIVVDYGADRPALTLLEWGNRQQHRIPVLYATVPNKRDLAVVLYTGSPPFLIQHWPMARLEEQIEAVRAVFAAADAKAAQTVPPQQTLP